MPVGDLFVGRNADFHNSEHPIHIHFTICIDQLVMFPFMSRIGRKPGAGEGMYIRVFIVCTGFQGSRRMPKDQSDAKCVVFK